MLLDVASLRKSPERSGLFHLSKEMVKLPAGGEELPLIEPVALEVTVTKEGKILHVLGKARALVEASCDRCLKTLTQEVTGEFEADFCHRSEAGAPFSSDIASHGEEQEVAEDPLILFEGSVIDLTDLALEALLLALPMKILCQEDCKGLCPGCGAELTTDRCPCQQEEVDPRLAILQKLLPKS